MKKITTILLMIFCITLNKNVFAGHVTGGEITYMYVSPNEYLVTLKLFHDCQGLPLNNVETVCFSSASCSSNFMHNVNKITSSELMQPACLIAGISSCQGGSVLGIEEVTYQDTVTLTGSCSDWVISYASCCLGNVNTISGSPSIYIEARLNNILAPTGSSPQFQYLALPRFCINNYSQYNFVCSDPDGDVLSYSFESVMDASGSCPVIPSPASYLIPYSPSNPLSSSIPITINSTGLMEFTPDMLGNAVFKVRINALGNGGITGSVMRQNVVYIVNGITGISDLTDENFKLSVFPKVSERYFNFSVGSVSNEKITINIFNTVGETVYSKEAKYSNSETNSIDLAGFSSGVYIASFTVGNKKRIEKIIKL